MYVCAATAAIHIRYDNFMMLYFYLHKYYFNSFFITELIERVLFRLGTAENDEKFELNVAKFLPPVLLKITSPNEAVRCKVESKNCSISNYSHIITFTYFTMVIL